MLPNDTSVGSEFQSGGVLEAWCDAWLQAWTGNQPDKLISFYHPEIYYRDPAHPEGLSGHARLKAYFEKLLAKNPNWVWRAVEIFPTLKGFTLKWDAEIPTAHGLVKEVGLDIVELSGDKILRNEVYFDPSRIRGD